VRRKFRQFWSSGNWEFLVSVLPFFDLYFDCMGKRLNDSIWLEEQGSPSGVARRVILRESEIGLNLEAGKSIQNVQCDAQNLNQNQSDRAGIERAHTFDSRRFRKNLSRLNLSSFDRVTGGGEYDFVAQI